MLCSPLKAPAFILVSCSAYSSTLKIEAIYSLETLVDFKQTIWCHIPEDSTIHKHHCENLKPYICCRD
jgi:hypothetical protein